MLKTMIRTGVLLSGALASTLNLAAQTTQPAHPKHRVLETNVAVTFNLERGQVAQTGSPSFWLKGGSANASFTFWKGLGIAANVTGGHASNITPNVGLSKIAFMAGPRYTVHAPRAPRTQVFGEALFGGVHAFDSVFPGTNAAQPSAGAFSMQVGGGADVALKKGFGIRAIEMDWVHTSLPNNADNTQNDLRIAFGISYRH